MPSTAPPTAVLDRIAKLYGSPELPRDAGVLHVTAAWRRSASSLVTLAIGPNTPRSLHDFFALNLARARADAIVVTGKILRDEPSLRYDLQGDLAEELASWRRTHMERDAPPLLAILTSGRGFDPTHPALHSWAPPVVFTTPAGASEVRALDPNLDLEVAQSVDVRTVVDLLRRRGARTISVEAGPRTTRGLYEPPLAVDELMLTSFEGPVLDEAVRAGEFLPPDELEARLSPLGPARTVQEPSGPWSFRRFLRPARGSTDVL